MKDFFKFLIVVMVISTFHRSLQKSWNLENINFKASWRVYGHDFPNTPAYHGLQWIFSLGGEWQYWITTFLNPQRMTAVDGINKLDVLCSLLLFYSTSKT